MAGYWSKKQGTIAITAGSDTFTFDDVGDFKASPLIEGNRDRVVVRHRGAIKSVEYGDEVEQSGSFSFSMPRQDFTDSSGRVLDAILMTGAYSGGTSQNFVTVDAPKLWSMKVQYTDGTTTASITFPRTSLSCDIDESGDVIIGSVSWTSYGTPVLV
jgi:hypothetical protein